MFGRVVVPVVAVPLFAVAGFFVVVAGGFFLVVVVEAGFVAGLLEGREVLPPIIPPPVTPPSC